MSSFSSSSSSSSCCRNVFDSGKYIVSLFQVNSKSSAAATSLLSSSSVLTKPLLIATPSDEGEYPILLFLHGYLLFNTFYSQLIQHIASHGFIVVAPQLYKVAGPDSSDEIKSAAAITEWLSDGLGHVLPPLVKPCLSKAALAGHSRGGKAAFALALSSYSTSNPTTSSNSSIKYLALMGIDPVDGMGKGNQTHPPVLTYVPRSFDLDMAVLVVGSGLGEMKRNPLFPPCAPKGVNHEDFYNECRSPACYFVVKDYGHTDMLDDETKGIRGKATKCTCKNGKTREPMRRFVGGIMVAFMKAYVEGDHSYLNAIKDRKEIDIPVELQKIDIEIVTPACLRVGNFQVFDSRSAMKIKKANAGALTNCEVLDFLRSRGASTDPTRVLSPVAPSEFQVYDYLAESAARNQTRESINEFLKGCEKYNLAKAEKLNVVNIRPSSMVEIYPIIEECEERLENEKVEELVELIVNVFPLPTEPGGTDDGDKEIPDGSTMEETN